MTVDAPYSGGITAVRQYNVIGLDTVRAFVALADEKSKLPIFGLNSPENWMNGQ